MRGAVAASMLAIAATLGVVRAQQGNGRPADRSGAQSTSKIQRNDDLQPAALPPLPTGMTVDAIVEGDRIFHGDGGCFVCHGVEAQGMPAAGDGITVGLSYIPVTWGAIDSLITVGMPDAISRSPIAMPASGAKGNLTPVKIQQVAAYVWAISQARGEPWPGGHESHANLSLPQAAAGTANNIAERQRRSHRTP